MHLPTNKKSYVDCHFNHGIQIEGLLKVTALLVTYAEQVAVRRKWCELEMIAREDLQEVATFNWLASLLTTLRKVDIESQQRSKIITSIESCGSEWNLLSLSRLPR